MSDIRSMFSKMQSATNGSVMDESQNGDISGESRRSNHDSPEVVHPQPKQLANKKTIEKTYQKVSQLEHVLLRPDTYIGSVQKVTENMWIYDSEKEMMIEKEIEYVPGLYKIFDEILVNAADNKQRDNKMDCIKIDINPDDNVISIYNNGQGIPIAMHKDENMYVPTMIFGHLLTSSNYNDEEDKVTGGRNGYGAKLCNIFSTKFTVETAAKVYKRQFRQTWGSNMTKASEPKIKDYLGEDYTKIIFSPDLSKFKMDKLDEDIVGLMSRRAFDVAASTRGVKVFLNGKRVPVKNFKDYIDLYIKGKEDDTKNSLKVIYEQCSDRWEVGLTLSDKGFQQVSFVNSIATTKGGRHVEYVVEMITTKLIDLLKKKNKGGINIKRFQVKNHLWIFVNCLIVNPTFSSQTKEVMTLQMKSFGSKCPLSDKFFQQVTKSGIVESVLSWAKFKAQNELDKKGGKKQIKLKGIPKLEDANEAGSKNALKCTLILTEGDSAKSMVVSGLAVIGRDYYGIFPLKGKILNVREATHKQIVDNQELNHILNILGLQYKKKYNTFEDMQTLRYGKVMIMTDQDQDGSHIKGLFINFIHHNWPELLKQGFLEQFITPIVKARKKKEVLSFYSLPEFEEWKSNTPNYKTYSIKYYKGLGTSDPAESREYFSNLKRHRIPFHYTGQSDDDHIVLAFSKKHIEHRKEWLTNFMVESRRRKEIGLPEKYLYGKDTKYVSYTDFINMELVLFSNGDNVRSIPSMVDGFKPGQRKVLYVCLKFNEKKEMKVVQLVGSVTEKAAYHHSDMSLAMTIVNMAQNFVGSNNINVLEPKGQFGTRLVGGKDSASPRYIFTKLSPLTRLIFPALDDGLLKYEYDDNIKIEPYWFIPILPMVLVNGADGIGTGWMTKIPNYNPREIIANLRRMLDGEDPVELIPWYKHFKGTIEYCGDHRYVISGEIAIINRNKVEITELPVGIWTQNYKENVLESMLHGSEKFKSVLSDYKDYSTDTSVKFVVSLLNGQMEEMEKEGLHKVFKLQTIVNTSSMCAFDEFGCLKRYDSVMVILQEFYTLRLKMYQKRKDFVLGTLGAEAARLSNQARFIMEKCSGELTVENKKRKTIVEELIRRNYPPDPVQEWKQKNSEDDEEEQTALEEQDESQTNDPSKKKKSETTHPDVKKFDYLLGMSMWMLTEERKNELLRQRDQKLSELETLRSKSNTDLWREDLDVFMEALDKYEQKELEIANRDVTNRIKKEPGKKKIPILETMPSPMGQRVAPTISEEMKKKIQAAVKSKENKLKRGIKKEIVTEEEEPDEFDDMLKSKKTLKDKLGTPEEVSKKARKKKGESDGLKQTKLNFPKANGKKRNKKARDEASEGENETSENDSDIEFTSVQSPKRKERVLSRRAATKIIKYSLSDDEEEEGEENDELFDNEAVKSKETVQEMLASSDEEEKRQPRHETSEDMFDSLVGRKKEVEKPLTPTNKRKKIEGSQSDSDDMFAQKKRKSKSSCDEEELDLKETNKRKKKVTKEKNVRKKKSSDDEDAQSKKKRGRPKRKNTSDDEFECSDITKSEDGSPIGKRAVRPGRVTAKSKYTFSDSDDSY